MNYYTLTDAVSSTAFRTIGIASVVIVLLIVLSIALRNPTESVKRLLFWSIVAITLGTSVFLVTSTFYVNAASIAHGPVHYHADFEIWRCGQEQDLLNPKGLSNKIGKPVIHEHNDKRIHIEGVVTDIRAISFGQFFWAIGGSLTDTSLVIPTNGGQISMKNGDRCGQKSATLQAFLITADNGKITQTKLIDPANHLIAQQAAVPPGDCIILEFDTPKTKTDKLCESYEVANAKGDIR